MTQRKLDEFAKLQVDVNACSLCQSMQGRHKVLSAKNGSLDACVVFIAEAPGRLGADKSMYPLSGDQTGRNFDALLEVAQIDRKKVFITNAVLCNPRDDFGNNARPSSQQLEFCAQYLQRTLDIVRPKIVVTLGQQALRSLNKLEQHQIKLSRASLDHGQTYSWRNTILYPLYHPSPKVYNLHRSKEEQENDFSHLRELIIKKTVSIL